MKDDEFRRRIEQLATIEDHKVAQVNIRSRRQLEEDPPVFPPGENPTLGFRIKSLKNQVRLCEMGCNKTVDSQVIEYRFGETPQPHWKTRCANCMNYRHPSGDGFIKGGHEVANEYARYFRNIALSRPRD